MSDKYRVRRGGGWNYTAGSEVPYAVASGPLIVGGFTASGGFRVVKETEPNYRVLRGGGWFSSDGFCRPARRYGNFPSHRFNNFGFRVVKETETNYRVLRSGSWYSNYCQLSSSLRFGIDPSFGFNNFGFRVVKGEIDVK